MPGDFAKRLTVLEPNKVLRGIFLGLLFGGPLLFLLALTNVFSLGFFGVHLTILGALLYAGHRRHNQRAKKANRLVRATLEGVFVDGTLAVPRAAIKDGFYQPRRPRSDEKYLSSVRIVGKRRQILFEAEMPDEEEALSFLHALGLDPASRRAEFNGGSPLFATVGRQVGTIFGTLGATILLSFLSAIVQLPLAGFSFWVFLPMIISALIPSKITIGVDGVLWRWLWLRRFFPMKDIRNMGEADENAVRLIIHPFKEHILYTSMRHKQSASVLMQNQRDAVLARIREAHRTFQRVGRAVDATALVARGTKKQSEWLQALMKLAHGEGNYREAVLRTEDLLHVVEDPHASEDARAGAAFVLRSSADEEVKARVRVAAEASASPKLRIALDAAAAGDEATIEEAMRELAEDEAAEAEASTKAGA